MKKIEFKNGIYVIEVYDNDIFVGYILKFRKRRLGYTYELTKDVTKAYRWLNFIACQGFYYNFISNKISWYEKSKQISFRAKEVFLDIKLKRKIKLDKIRKIILFISRLD